MAYNILLSLYRSDLKNTLHGGRIMSMSLSVIRRKDVKSLIKYQ